MIARNEDPPPYLGCSTKNGKRIYEGQQVDIGYHYEPLARHIFELEKISPIGYTPPSTVELYMKKDET